jgi:hypothetical protein
MYNAILRRLRDAFRRFLFHGNAPAHKSVFVRDFLATALEHPPNSPDLTAADFYLFL